MTRFVFICLVGAVAVSPVQKVIQLLDELQGKVENDLSTEEKMMQEYTTWCDEEANAKEDSITSNKRTVSDLMATIEDAKASIGSLTSSVGELTQKISADEAELSTATSLRSKENGDFAASEKELKDTVDTLERSTAVLKKNLGLVQTGRTAKMFGGLVSGLKKIVEASWVNAQQKSVVQALLQSQTEESDEDLSFQPQATAASYSSQSGGILDTIADMQGKAEEALSSARKDEMQSAHEFAMLKQGMEDEIAVAKKQLGEATLQKSTTEEELHAAEESLAETQNTLAADTKYLSDLRQSCATKANQWAARQEQAVAETEAIEKAKSILSDGVKVLLQTSVKVRSTQSDGVRQEVSNVLGKLAKKFHSYALVELASRSKSDPFGKIRGLIEGMIGKLTQQAAEEADQKSFCDQEMSESNAKKADLNGKLDKTTARINKAVAGKAKLQEAIKTLESEVAQMDSAQAEATSVRAQEHEDNTQAMSDFRDSAAAVAKAIDVLSEYYSSASFIQVKQPEFGEAKSDVGSSIVSILEVAESDFTSMLAATEADESSAKAAYDKMTQENAVTKTTKLGDAKGKTNEVKQLDVALSNYKENKDTTSQELDAVLDYLDKLKPQCEAKVMTYAEKKARREQEIAGLKEALTILSGEALLQVKTTLRGARRA